MVTKEKIMMCCNKFMEAKGLSLNPANGCGFIGYSVLYQCNKCGRISIKSVQSYGGEHDL